MYYNPPPGMGGGSQQPGPAPGQQWALPVATYANPPQQQQPQQQSQEQPYPQSQPQQQAWSEKAPPPQIWGEAPPPPQPYPAAYHPQQPIFLAAGGGFQAPQFFGNGAPQVIVMGPHGMVPMPLEDGIPEDFASAGSTSAAVAAFCSLLSLSLAAAALGTPWALMQAASGVSLASCSLAFGLTSYGLLGSGCPEPPLTIPVLGSTVLTTSARWPTAYATSPTPLNFNFQGALWVDAWLALTVLFFLLASASAALLSGRYARAPAQAAAGAVPRLHFATVRVLEGLTAAGFAVAWVAGAWGLSFFNSLRAAFSGNTGIGSGQFMAQVLFACSVTATVIAARMKCGIRSLGLSRTPDTCCFD